MKKKLLFNHISLYKTIVFVMLFVFSCTFAGSRDRFLLKNGKKRTGHLLYIYTDSAHIAIKGRSGGVVHKAVPLAGFEKIWTGAGKLVDLNKTNQLDLSDKSLQYKLLHDQTIKLRNGKETILEVLPDPMDAKITLLEGPYEKKTQSKQGPSVFTGIEYDKIKLLVQRVGYEDKEIDLSMSIHEVNIRFVKLKSAPPQLVRQQKRERRKIITRKIGTPISIAGVLAAAGGGVFMYLAQKDYSASQNARETYTSSVFLTEEAQKNLLHENQKMKNDGDAKSELGKYLLLGGGAGVAVGLVFVF